MPLRGASAKLMAPSTKNVYNKFSVRYFLRVIFTVATKINKRKQKKKRGDDEDSSQEEQSEAEESENSDWEVLERQEAATTIESNFLEIVLTR